jgi:hypothetical protein
LAGQYDADLFCYDGHQLPELFILGSQKCGTTALSTWLRDNNGASHGTWCPEDAAFPAYCDGKEHHFFDSPDRVKKGIGNYAAQFAKCGNFTYDATPDYARDAHHDLKVLRDLYGPERLARTTFVMLLCEPVQRTQSYYYHFLKGHSHTYAEKVSMRDYNFTIWTGGEYGTQLSDIATTLGHVGVLPTQWFDADAKHSITQLTRLVRSRSGRPGVLSPIRDPPRMPHSNSRLHPRIEVDANMSDLVAAAAHYQGSNRRVYDEVYGPRKSITLIGKPKHFHNRDPNALAFLDSNFLGEDRRRETLESFIFPHINASTPSATGGQSFFGKYTEGGEDLEDDAPYEDSSGWLIPFL